MSEESRVLKPLGLGDLYDEAFILYRKNFLTIFGIALVPSVINISLSLILDPASTTSIFDLYGDVFMGRRSGDSLIPVLLTFVSALTFMIASAALVSAVSDLYLGRSVSIASAYRMILPRSIPLVLSYLLLMLLLFLSVLPVVVFAVAAPVFASILSLGWSVFAFIFAFWIAFVPNVFVVEDLRYFEALGRSRRLAKGFWLRIFGIIGLFALIVFYEFFLISSFMLFVFGFWVPIISYIVLQLLTVFFIPVVVMPLTLQYFDSRVKGEGFDLELLAQELRRQGARHEDLSSEQRDDAD